ncbi:MAG TPA: 2-oxo acid dehydrogenase subunit E2 [Mucilaginibacter sp.]|jgi:2-oxoglutarate dehydrogenase E2 component (dihydrolipoamide succinyltransferase)|nr:2-oxo acid dehydrogenase subunit E2 [Mucilaginibacter sp.]
MAKYQLLLPKMGESVAEATIIKWNKAVGDTIETDEAVMEIATDKVDSEVPSPVSGRLVEQLCKENDVVQVGSVIAIIDTGGDAEEKVVETSAMAETPQEVAPDTPAVEEPEAEKETFEDIVPESLPGIDQLQTKETTESTAEPAKGLGRFYSPLVKNIAAQEGISAEELDQIPGTGAEGRLTKDDLLNYVQNPAAYKAGPAKTEPQGAPQAEPVKPPSAPEPKPESTYVAPEPQRAAPQSAPAVSVSGSDEIIEMDRMRRLIADHMVMSKQTSPHVTSFVEADVTNIVQWRDKVKNSFEKKEGEKITFTPIFIEAVVKAIRDFPMVNVSVNGNQIIKKAAINIGMATALPSGNLIVPVIKRADQLNLVGLTKAVNDLANRSRNNKLQPDEVKDGTFTITNVGSFGNIMGTPIINQPQAAILAVGAIKKKPAVIETPQGDMIGIRHLMFLSLSYDHRVVDGALGGSFLRRIADYLEGWDVNRAV